MALARMKPRSLVLAALILASAAFDPRRDVDVAIPPGTPLDWTRAIPLPTPRETPLIPTVGKLAPADPARTVATPRGFHHALPSSFGAIRILTWDLTSEVP
jgi:hypothetical protein